jgi:hypothetical protein
VSITSSRLMVPLPSPLFAAHPPNADLRRS